MELRDYVIAGFVLSIMLIGINLFQSNWATGAGQNNLTNVSGWVDTDLLQDQVQDVEDSITGSQITGTLLDIPITVISGLYSIVKLMGTVLGNFWTGTISAIAMFWGIPAHYVVLITAAVIVGIIFTVLAVLFNRSKGI